ncbi:MAG TPA: hypothetical protein PK821_08365, partial [Victivallales bacterium]|nr:hypothetical protein [Victivallales bacterium]
MKNMSKLFSVMILSGFLLYGIDLSSQSSPTCVVCGKKIAPGAKFLRTQDSKIFCSKGCFVKTLPKCCVCGGLSDGGYLKGSDGKLYCSKACISTTWPSCMSCGEKSDMGATISSERGPSFYCERCMSKPRCFCCGLPDNCSPIADGRMICRECAKDAVQTLDEAVTLVNDVRRVMSETLRLSTEHNIE